MKAGDVKTIAMIGAGDMGHGIAAICLMGGYKVILRDIDAENLDNEIKEMTIGKSAVAFFQDDIEKFKVMFMDLLKSEKKSDEYLEDGLFIGQLGDLSDVNWNKIIAEFFVR